MINHNDQALSTSSLSTSSWSFSKTMNPSIQLAVLLGLCTVQTRVLCSNDCWWGQVCRGRQVEIIHDKNQTHPPLSLKDKHCVILSSISILHSFLIFLQFQVHGGQTQWNTRMRWRQVLSVKKNPSWICPHSRLWLWIVNLLYSALLVGSGVAVHQNCVMYQPKITRGCLSKKWETSVLAPFGFGLQLFKN